MACSLPGLTVVLAILTAVVLNTMAFALPQWSRTNNGQIVYTATTSDFAAGLWGFCTDLKFLSSNDSNNHCYLFHTSSKYDFAEFGDQMRLSLEDKSVCSGFAAATQQGDWQRRDYANTLASSAKLNTSSFLKFLDRSCGSAGLVSLSLGAICMGSDVVALVLLVLGVTCCKVGTPIFFVARLMAVVSLATGVVTLAVWSFQAAPLNDDDDVSFYYSFAFGIVGAVFNVFTLASFIFYADKADRLDLVWTAPCRACGRVCRSRDSSGYQRSA